MIAGRFDLKLKAIYKGLISQQATQVEPCYKGKLYCFLHNLGEQEVSLKAGEKLATIEFSYVGQELKEKERQEIIRKTIAHNKEKYVNSPFVDEAGIKDIRWLHQCGMLPKDSGVAPIYHLVHHNLESGVEKYLETSDAVEKLAERVDSKMSEKQNAIKIVLALITAVITFFTGSFLMDVTAELQYFREELAFFAESTLADQAASLEAIQAHTAALAEQQSLILGCSIACISIIVILLLVFFMRYFGPQYERKWARRQKNRAKLEAATTVYENACVKLEAAKAEFRKLRNSFRKERSAPPDESGK